MQLLKMTAFIVASIIGSGLSTPVMAFELLDDMIYSVKCAAAEDVAACKTKAKQAYDDYARTKQAGSGNGPVQVSPGEPSPAWQPPPQQCYTVEASGAASVDGAYATVVDYFGFMTLAEKTAWIKQRGGRAKDDAFKHRAIPGQLYDMTDTVSFPAANSQRLAMFSSVKLKRSNAGGSSLNAEYCLWGSAIAYSSAIGDVFRNAVK